MANYGSKDVAFILLGGYSLLGDTTQIRDKVIADTAERMALGDAWPAPAALGRKRADLSQAGFFNDATNAIHDALNGNQGVSRVLCYGVEGNSIGRHFRGFAGALEIDYERVASLSGFHLANATYQGNGQVDEGVILQPHDTKTADWDTTADSVDAGASSADGGAGYLQVSAFSGFTGFVGKVRHSADDSVYADLITFTNVTAAPAAERLTVAGTVNRYLAFDGNVTGTGSITVMAGFGRN